MSKDVLLQLRGALGVLYIPSYNTGKARHRVIFMAGVLGSRYAALYFLSI
jgi:hypothetical protein